MLVIGRRVSESIVVGPGQDEIIRIFVIRIMGDEVRIGIEAPNHWFIMRGEIHDACGGGLDWDLGEYDDF